MLENNSENTGKNSKPKSFIKQSDFLKSISEIGARTLEFDNTLSQIDVSTASIIEKFGGARDRIQEMTIGISDASSKILLLSDDVSTYEDAMARAAQIAGEVADATNRNYMATSENIEDIVAASEASNVNSSTLIKNFTEQGYSLNTISENMQKVVNTTRALGVNTKAVSDSVVANLSKLNTFNFANGIEGLTRMAAKASLFNIDMSKILQKADELFDPEKAVDMAASLQRLGVTTGDLLDPLKLMDLGQNNPEELQKQIIDMSKRFTYFNEQNQKFEIMPGAKRELREIAGVIGMSADELAKMALGSSTLADKMSKIRFPTLKTDITEDQKELIANMSEMKDGKYMIQVERRDEQGRGLGEFDFKDVSLLDDTDIKNLKDQYSESNKTLEETAKDQLTIQKRSLGQLEAIASSFRGGAATSKIVRKGSESLAEQFDNLANVLTSKLTSKKVRETGDELTPLFANFGKTMVDLLSGKISQEEAENRGKDLDKFFKDKFGVGMKTLDELFEKAITGYDEIIETVANSTKKETTASNLRASNTTSPTQTVNPTDVLQREVDNSFGIFQNIQDFLKLNETQKPQSEVLPKNNLNTLNTVNLESNPIAVNSKSPIEVFHKFENINFNVKVDAPIGTNTALLTEAIDKALRDPNVLAKLTLNTQQMQNNYGITGGKVGEYVSTAVV
jgi:hypothetical protein